MITQNYINNDTSVNIQSKGVEIRKYFHLPKGLVAEESYQKKITSPPPPPHYWRSTKKDSVFAGALLQV